MSNLNYKLMLSASSIANFAASIIGPFLVILINQKGGGIENLGLVFGAGIIANSLTQLLIGRLSDKLGRKPFLVISSIINAVVIISYLYVQNLTQLYILQIVAGIDGAIWGISETSFMADITQKKTRGKSLGFYNMFIGILIGIGMMIGGFAINKFGYTLIFWIVGLFSLLSAIFFWMIKEKR